MTLSELARDFLNKEYAGQFDIYGLPGTCPLGGIVGVQIWGAVSPPVTTPGFPSALRLMNQFLGTLGENRLGVTWHPKDGGKVVVCE